MATKSTKTKQSEEGGSTKRFSPFMVRSLGAFVMFVGLMLCVLLNSMTPMLITVVSLVALVLGFYMFVGGIRVMAGKRSGTDAKQKGAVWFVTGLLLIAAGVLGLLYRGAIATWVLVGAGAFIAVCGLVMLVMLAVAKRSHCKMVLDVVLSVATMVVGVLIALLVVPAVGNAVNHLCYYLFGALAIAVGGMELILY